MSKRKKFNQDEFDFDEENQVLEEERNGFFDHLYETEDECQRCGYFGPLKSTRKGYRCPDCGKLVVRHE